MPPVATLPADAPKIVVNGGIYSERRDIRAAIVNGQVVREGQDVGPGVVLEEIRPGGVVLAFRGARYTVIY
jgi:general secretion pathway protein B